MSSIPSPNDNPKYTKLISELRTLHGELRTLDLGENPSLIGDHLGKLRLGANLLFSFLNNYYTVLSDLQEEVAKKRQELYEAELKEKSPSASETHSRNLTRVDEAKVEIVKNYISQIKNEYERYNGICMYLQSRLKEFNTERMLT